MLYRKLMNVSGRIGSFDLLEQLGEGPHGPVHLAVDTVRDRMIAVKLFDALQGQTTSSEFHDNVVSLARVTAPQFGTIFSCSQPGDSLIYLAREYINGISVAEIRTHFKSLGAPFLCAVMSEIALAVEAIHSQDLIHNNLKLTNVFLQESGGVKLVDPAVATHVGSKEAVTLEETLSPNGAARQPDLRAIGQLLQELTAEVTLPEPMRQLATQCQNHDSSVGPNSAKEIAERITSWLQRQGEDSKTVLRTGADSLQYVFLMARTQTATNTPKQQVISDISKPPEAKPKTIPLIDVFEDDLLKQPQAELAAKMRPPVLFSPEDTFKAKPKPPVSTPAKSPMPVPYFAIAAAVMGVLYAAVHFWPSESVEPEPTQPAPEISAKEESERKEALLTTAKKTAEMSPQEALSAASRAVGAMPENWEAQYLLGRALIRSGNKAEGAKSLETAISIEPERIESHLALTKLMLGEKKLGKATNVLKRALELHGTDGQLRYLLGKVLVEQRQDNDAEKALELAVRLNSRNADGWLLLGNTRLRLRKASAAKDAFEKAALHDPQNGKAFVGLGRALLALGKGGDAIDILAKGQKFAPDSPELSYAFGRVFLFEGQPDNAETHLVSYVRKAPKDWRGHFSLGLARLRLGRIPAAITAFTKAQQLQPNQAETEYNLGIAHTTLRQPKEAIAYFEKAISSRYSLWQAHCELGRSHQQLGEYKKATASYNTTLKLNPKSLVAKSIVEASAANGLGHLLAGLSCSQARDMDIVD